MATYHASITDEQAALICNAPLFFVASADPALARGPHDVGPVNVSAKGGVDRFLPSLSGREIVSHGRFRSLSGHEQ